MVKNSIDTERKKRLLEMFIEYEYLIESRDGDAANRIFIQARDLVPNAGLSDLYYYGERERTFDELADEALLREAIFEKEGQEALRAYLIKNMEEVCANSSASRLDIKHARMKLDELYKENAQG